MGPVDIVRYTSGGSGPAQIGVREDGQVFSLPGVDSLAALWSLPLADIRQRVEQHGPARRVSAEEIRLLPPIDGRTEVWAAGVKYQSSRLARVADSERSADVYERVYEAQRPELFFKSASWRVVGDGQVTAIRDDSVVSVPEPEVALVINRFGEIAGYCVCNDMSSRSIDGENPLYLPQAKTYLGGCALGPVIRPAWEIANPYSLAIDMAIVRHGGIAWHGSASTAALRRRFTDLIGYLLHADVHPDGVVLTTGTCLVPPAPFSLADGDVVRIEIAEVGVLTTSVVCGLAAMRAAFEPLIAAGREGSSG
jgi:2-dehydro-3-deoxy-D-arabinonate dehydratase